MTKDNIDKIRTIDLLMIAFGCQIFALSLVLFNIKNNLADGGVSGLTLILKAIFNINPAYTTVLLNAPLIILGYKYLGHRSLIYTIFGTIMLSFWLWIWQRIPLNINLHHDLFLASVTAGIIGGFGQGIVYRFGGTTGGTDILAKIFQRFKGIKIGHTLLWLDVIILSCSLVYIDLRHMAYTLVYSYIASKMINSAIEGPYQARGNFIISLKNKEITESLIKTMGRGITIFEAKGAFLKKYCPVIYITVSLKEIHELKEIVLSIDPKAFITSFSVSEVTGEGFTYNRPKKKKII